MPGMGLWLLIDGDAPVEWTRPIAPDGAVLRLRRGLNLVGWTSLREAWARLLMSAWDGTSGEYGLQPRRARRRGVATRSREAGPGC